MRNLPHFLLGASLLSACAGDVPTPRSDSDVDPAPAAPPPTATERASWPAGVGVSIDRGCAGPACTGSALAIEVTSLRPDPVEIELFLSADGLDARAGRIRAGGGTLGGGERRRFTVDAAAMPIQPLGTLATARAELVVDADGRTVGAISSPIHYEHAAGFGAFTLYDDTGAFTRAATLRPADRARPTGRVWNGHALVDVVPAAAPVALAAPYQVGGASLSAGDVPPVAAPGDPTDPTQPPAPVGTKLCFDLKVQYNDAGVGEDYLGAAAANGVPAVQAQNAAYMRAWITKEDVTVWTGYLTSAGCTPTLSLTGLNTLKVQSQFEKLIGGVAAHHDVRKHGLLGDLLVTWSRDFIVFLPNQNTTINLTPNAPDHTQNVAGVLARMYVASDLWVPTGNKTTYVDKGCPGLDPPTDSCYSGAVYIGPGASPAPPQANAKFLVAHEYGHFAQGNKFSLHGFNYNAVIDDNGACRCDHVVSANQLHCMQSLEQYAAAFIEGFAHFYASRLYNSRFETDCHFGYYKEIFILFGVLTPTVPVDCQSSAEWRDQFCSDLPNSAVEMDVMRFLWALHSDLPDRLSMEEIGDLLDAAQDHAGFTPIEWGDLVWGSAQVFGNPSAKHTKVLTAAAAHSVN